MHWSMSTAHAGLTSKQARTGHAMSSLVTLTMIWLQSASLTYTRQWALLSLVGLKVGELRPGGGGAYSASPPYCSSTA